MHFIFLELQLHLLHFWNVGTNKQAIAKGRFIQYPIGDSSQFYNLVE
jgi:hypothetical protein